MKSLKSMFKRVVAGVLLSTMVMCGTTALASKPEAAPGYNDFVGDTVYSTNKSPNYDTKHSTSKTKVKGVTVGWVDYDIDYIHVEWKKKAGAKSYEIAVSRSNKHKYLPCEYMRSKTNSCTNSSVTSYVFNPNEHKTYYVRVRAVYKGGTKGPWSAAVKLRTTKKYKLN